MRDPAALALALLAALVLGAPGQAIAALPPAPFEVDVVPGALVVGAPGAVRLVPRPADGTAATAVDVYVVRLPGGPPVPRYLDRAGGWSARMAPYATEVVASGGAPVDAAWREAGPAGWITVLVLFLRPGAEPSHRPAWVYAPVLTRVRVRDRPGPRWPPPPWFALAGVATGAAAVVLLLPWLRAKD